MRQYHHCNHFVQLEDEAHDLDHRGDSKVQGQDCRSSIKEEEQGKDSVLSFDVIQKTARSLWQQ